MIQKNLNQELLKNLKQIRKSLQALNKGMNILLSVVSYEDEETQGSLELETPRLTKETLDKYRSYLS